MCGNQLFSFHHVSLREQAEVIRMVGEGLTNPQPPLRSCRELMVAREERHLSPVV